MKDVPHLHAPVDDNDRDRGNVLIRAGYVWGIAAKDRPITDEDRDMLARASRSLRAYAEELIRPQTSTIEQLVRHLLIARGWTVDDAAIESRTGARAEFIHPETKAPRAWLDALLDEQLRERR